MHRSLAAPVAKPRIPTAMEDSRRCKPMHEKTSRYWKTFLHDFKPCYFPALLENDENRTSTTGDEDSGSRHHVIARLEGIDQAAVRISLSQQQITLAGLLQTAWAIIVADYAGVEDVSFGFQDLESDHDVLVCRTSITGDRIVREMALEMARRLGSSRSHHRECSMSVSDVQELLGIQGQPMFNSGLQLPLSPLDEQSTASSEDRTNFNILAQASVTDDCITISINTDPSRFSASRTEDVAHTFAKTIESLVKADLHSLTLGDLDTFSPRDYGRVMSWNDAHPTAVEDCFHAVFERVASRTPEAPAICSFEGRDYTYRELNEVTTRTADHLVSELGVSKPETPVLICFDKSSIALISMLAIFKAGGAFVAIDPSYMKARIQAIVEATNASLALLQPEHRHLFDDIVMTEKRIVALDARYLDRLPPPTSNSILQRTSPSDTAYIHFTSGSTGVPKGIMIEHRQLCTAASALATPMHISNTSRVLQFAAYIFDLSFGDIFVTLSQGGCICNPSEHERINDLAGAINRMDVNTACLVPSVARILRPETVPDLRTLLLGGEALVQENLERWAGKVALNAMYGPSECTVWCTSQIGLKTDSQANNIGRGYGARLWVTRNTNHDRLVPIGCVGELLIEGPVLARGYLNPEQTKQAFVEDPAWTKRTKSPSEHRRFYKTGDLVKYNPDGTLSFVGRKDTQIKLHGRRIEIGEIEHHLATHPLVRQSMVVLPNVGVHAKRLVAIIALVEQDASSSDDNNEERKASVVMSSKSHSSELAEIKTLVSSKLPSYMLPQAWIVVVEIPLLISAKMNRVLVKQFVETLKSEEERSQTPLHGAHKNAVDTELINDHCHETHEHTEPDKVEERLRSIWGQALNIDNLENPKASLSPGAAIGADQSFLSLGGDSFSAMDLVARCRGEGLVLTVQNVLSNSSTIRQMARMIKKQKQDTTTNTSLVPTLKLRPIWWHA